MTDPILMTTVRLMRQDHAIQIHRKKRAITIVYHLLVSNNPHINIYCRLHPQNESAIIVIEQWFES